MGESEDKAPCNRRVALILSPLWGDRLASSLVVSLDIVMHAQHYDAETTQQTGGRPMRVMTIRNVPEEVHRALVRLARRNRRSLQQQVLRLLETVRRLDRESPVDEARALREKLEGRTLGDTVAEIREDRGR
jgi:plasmid stability protein